MLTTYLTNFVGKADGLIGLGHSLASLGNPCATPKLLLITVSIFFEKFPDKTHALWSRCCGWPCYQGHGLLDIQMMTKVLHYQAFLD
jgi:hypothetical protein